LIFFNINIWWLSNFDKITDRGKMSYKIQIFSSPWLIHVNQYIPWDICIVLVTLLCNIFVNTKLEFYAIFHWSCGTLLSNIRLCTTRLIIVDSFCGLGRLHEIHSKLNLQYLRILEINMYRLQRNKLKISPTFYANPNERFSNANRTFTNYLYAEMGICGVPKLLV